MSSASSLSEIWGCPQGSQQEVGGGLGLGPGGEWDWAPPSRPHWQQWVGDRRPSWDVQPGCPRIPETGGVVASLGWDRRGSGVPSEAEERRDSGLGGTTGLQPAMESLPLWLKVRKHVFQ